MDFRQRSKVVIKYGGTPGRQEEIVTCWPPHRCDGPQVQLAVPFIVLFPSRWKLSPSSSRFARRLEPPHVALANVWPLDLTTGQPTASSVPAMADAKSFVQFVKRYGPLPPRPEEQSLGLPGHRETFENPVAFGEIQLVLRSAWRGDNSAIDLIAAEDQETARDRWHLFLQNKAESAGIERKTFEGSPIEWSPADPIRARVSVGTNLEIVVEDLWSLIRLLFLQDHRGDRTRICNNEKCLAPLALGKSDPVKLG